MEAATRAATTNARKDTFEFMHHQAAVRLPEGLYWGQTASPAHVLGDNGAGIVWVWVTITKTPLGAEDWLGKQLNIRVRGEPSNGNGLN